MREIVKKHAREGGSVILSSHNMLEVEYLCSRLAFIHQGRITVEGEPQTVKDRYRASNLEEAFLGAIRRWEA